MFAGQSWVILVQQACRWYRKILETCCWPVSIRFHPPELPSPFSYTYMKLLSLLNIYSSNLFLSLSPFTSIEKKRRLNVAQARFENHIQTQSTSQWFPQQCCRAKNSLKLYHKVLGLHILPEFTYETIWPNFKLSPFITEINNITCLLKKNTLYMQSFCGLKKMVEIPFSCLTRRKHH